MDYQEYVFTINGGEEYQRDLLIQALSETGFDTFEETDKGFNAYVAKGALSDTEFKTALKEFAGLEISYQHNHIKQENWNQVWESNFEPLVVSDNCYVRATFHEPKPQYQYEIVIDPKMAFGTGHHQTTTMMMQFMLEGNFEGKTVLDMGCGTGILAILADKLLASNVVAIDYDEICYQSTQENSALNHTDNVVALCGSSESIPDKKFDIILANINRNILLDQLDRYVKVLKAGGMVFLSGFYEMPDMEIIINKAKNLGLAYACHKKSADWVAVKFVY